MDKKREPRLVSLLEQELSKLIAREIDIPTGTIVSVSGVELSSDNRSAKVGIGVYPSENADNIIEDLKKHSGSLHYKLIRILDIRRVPELNFYLDHGVEHAAKVEKALMDE